MLETLFLIPHEIAGIPIFGIGWAMGVWAIALVCRLVSVSRLIARGQSGVDESSAAGDAASLEQWTWPAWFAGEGFFWLIAAAVIWKVVPAVELTNVDEDPVGLAIRGYGVFLLTGVVAGIALATYRARKAGIDPNVIMNVAPWAFFGGIGGARLFYVVQYRDTFIGDSMMETITNMLKFTEGGLVVYGAFIGGSLAVAYYLYRHQLPILKMGDVIVPCMFIGLFFGRMGCLMHGCCWGGRCESQATSLEFPMGSPVYRDQMQDGSLVGFSYDSDSFLITSVKPGSIAEQSGLETGQRIDRIFFDDSAYATASREVPREVVPLGLTVITNQARHRFTSDQLPSRALPVYPAQLISSLSGLVLCILLHLIPLGRYRDGMVMLTGFACYAVLRFGLEIIRVDEAGQFGTQLSISQWVSVMILISAGIGAMALRWQSPSRPVSST